MEARKAAGALPGQSRLAEEAGHAAVQPGGEDADHAEVQRAVQEAVQAAVQEGVQRAVLDATEGYAMGDGVTGDVGGDVGAGVGAGVGQEALQKLEARQQAHKEAVQKREAKQAAKLQAKREAAAELEAMFSPDEQAVLREMDELEAELFQLEASMEQMGIDWRGVQVSEVALGLLLKSGWLDLEPPASLELKAEKQSAHRGKVCSVAFSPDGATIVSGSSDSTIKVWDAGVRRHWYRLNPQPKTDRFPACGSFPGAQGREAERAQRHSVLCGLLPRRRDPRLGLRRQDDQSLGCRQLPSSRGV